MKANLKNKKTLIIVSGGSGTGKSRAADELLLRIADRTERISYDDIKEAAYDRLGYDDAEEKKRIDRASLSFFYETLDGVMARGVPVLIEYPFYQFHRERLRELIEKHGYDAFTVYLHTDPRTAYERGILRDDAGGRHPGHLLTKYHKETFRPEDLSGNTRETETYEEFLRFIDGRDYNVRLGQVISVDVSDYAKVSYDEICRALTGG